MKANNIIALKEEELAPVQGGIFTTILAGAAAVAAIATIVKSGIDIHKLVKEGKA